mgnify:CR=1 FL=1
MPQKAPPIRRRFLFPWSRGLSKTLEHQIGQRAFGHIVHALFVTPVAERAVGGHGGDPAFFFGDAQAQHQAIFMPSGTSSNSGAALWSKD